jgi:hypothetical protein
MILWLKKTCYDTIRFIRPVKRRNTRVWCHHTTIWRESLATHDQQEVRLELETATKRSGVAIDRLIGWSSEVRTASFR